MLQSLIANLPDEGDPKREEEEAMAKAVAAVAYAGKSVLQVPLNLELTFWKKVAPIR